MLYQLLKIWVRAASFLFCRTLRLSDRKPLNRTGPLLLAVNHPNSFLDAVILDILFREPVYSLARGDAFRQHRTARWLRRLKMLPVYRTSEGVENLGENYRTFEACRSIFQKNGVVLIFSEGLCENEWRLRPLKKGTARLAFSAWEAGIPLTVLPVVIQYQSFRRFGKNVFIDFGEPLQAGDFVPGSGFGKNIQQFNDKLAQQFRRFIHEIEPADRTRRIALLGHPVPAWQKWLLALPAALGWLLHAPYYGLIRGLVFPRTRHTIHYDSVMTGLLALLYPVYLGLLVFLGWLLLPGATGLLLLPLAPLLARAWVWIAPQV